MVEELELLHLSVLRDVFEDVKKVYFVRAHEKVVQTRMYVHIQLKLDQTV